MSLEGGLYYGMKLEVQQTSEDIQEEKVIPLEMM